MALILAISALYGGDRSSQDMGQPYDDIKELGSSLDPKHPIESVSVSWGNVIDGISITYRRKDNTTFKKEHGSQTGPGRKIDTITLEQVSGVQGESLDHSDWGCQVTRLSFTIFDSTTGLTRSVGMLGAGKQLDQESRQDILVRGLLAGLKGISNDKAPLVGLNSVQFYTISPVQEGVAVN
ncbi:hypothetical protein RhiJN_18538 [Ceratobasidium sp. AG-Ba]|nr:hypothetical protein RhiJN_18538 [Ceratobasidium sp. AG-Ba]